MPAWSPCTRCPTPTPPGVSMCPRCKGEAERVRRPHGNPYATAGHARFREAVLARDPVCVLCLASPSTVADHYPHERRDLVDMGADPNDPNYGRGLCKPCHDKHTARTSPGGWNQRD